MLNFSRLIYGICGFFLGFLLFDPSISRLAAAADATKHRIYSHRLEPREHPDYSRRHVKPPDWNTFENRTRFTGLRGFSIEHDRIVNATQELDLYTRTHQVGEVVWPAYPILFAQNLGDLAEEIKRRNLFLFDIWGFVPGSGPGGYWQQYKPPAGVLEMLEAKLGERWLGMDVGEQDGRYIGGYASQMVPNAAGRFEQYLNFQRHFQRMCDDLGNKMSTLVSLNYGHYFLKEGVYTLIGAETAQALPNAQIYYSFIRGAGKQYGVPWFGNASIFNRWGYKTYGSEGEDHSPTKGTSLSLLKRLIYTHILYNSVFVGFESSWFGEKNTLSPVGEIQQAAGKWMQANGQPGEMTVPIALMVDFFAGWTFPRHLYTGNVYRVWGNLPYESGDYLTDGVLDLLYPGYQNSSYYHDESGFLTATPYGDAADCLLSDAPAWLLKRYAVLVIAGELNGGAEIHDKLLEYTENGGRLVLTAGNVAKFSGGIAGIQVKDTLRSFPAGTPLNVGETTVKEENPFVLYPLQYPTNAKILCRIDNFPAAIEIPYGSGCITVLAAPYGIGSQSAVKAAIANEVDQPLAKPYPLLQHVRVLLDRIFRNQKLFDPGKDLSWVTCRKSPGEYVLGISNNSWQERPLRIESFCGPIQSIEELPLDQSEKSAVGYLPENLQNINLGNSSTETIAGGDIRIFKVRIQETTITPIAHQAPPPRPMDRLLPLRGIDSIQEAVLARPTFFEHFDGVVVDWRYVYKREKTILSSEAGWISRQGLRVVVDLSSGINLYPDLRLVENDAEEYSASMKVIEAVLNKMEALHAQDIVLSLHRFPENNFTTDQSWKSFDATLKEICRKAEEHKITVHLRIMPGKELWNLREAAKCMERVAAPNFRMALSTAAILSQKITLQEIQKLFQNQIGFLLLSAPQYDISGKLWSIQTPIRDFDAKDKLGEILSLFPKVSIVLDAVYPSPEDEYLDAKELERNLLPGRP